MKRILTFALAAVLSAACLGGCGGDGASSGPANTSGNSSAAGQSLSGTVKTGGSTSVSKVMKALIQQFQNDNGKVTVNYEENGSGDGIKNTLSDLYEIGHSSRELKSTETGLTVTPYAIDGIAIILHKNNAVANLTQAQLRDIYTGKITKWSEVGGADELITVVIREEGSGTRSAFGEIVGLETDDTNQVVANANQQNSTGAVQTAVSNNSNAIGYISYSDMDTAQVKACQYEGVDITTDTLKNDSYKLKREFLLVTKEGATLSAAAQAFIDFILSDAGKSIIEDNKLLPK